VKVVKEKKEQNELAKAVMSRKNKKLYDIMQKSKSEKIKKVDNLKKRAAKIKKTSKQQNW